MRDKVNRPLFSVVVASYNYEHFVIETLASLADQTFRDFEIIVVDDGSQDDSVTNIRKFINEIEADDIDIRLLTHPGGVNKGLPATVELGVREARGRYVAFCESDDLWTENHLEEVAKVIVATRSRFIVNDVEIFGDKDRCEKMGRIRKDRILHEGCNRISPIMFAEKNYVLTFSAVAVRADCLLKCDFSSAAHPAALDWWLWRQIAYRNPVYFIAQKLTKWRMHNSYICRCSATVDLRERDRVFICAGSVLLRRRYPWSSKWWFGSWRMIWNNCKRCLRGYIKWCLPYVVQRNFANRKYGMSYPNLGVGWALLPFGLVCALKGMDPDVGMPRKVFE